MPYQPEPLAALVQISPGQRGEEVRNLHQILVRLEIGDKVPGLLLPEAELRARWFGRETRTLVGLLYDEAGLGELPAEGITTAAAEQLNEYLVRRQLLALAEGTARDAAGNPATGYRIQIHDRRNLDGAAAAETVVTPEGFWRAFYDPRFYLEAREGVIERIDTVEPVARALDPQGNEVARSEPTQHPARIPGRARIDLLLPGEWEPPPPDAPPVRPIQEDVQRRVRGWLEDARGRRLAGYRVVVYDRDIGPLRDSQKLGEVVTEREGGGGFTIAYSLQDVSAGDALPESADLVFRLFDTGGSEKEGFLILRQPVSGDAAITVELPVPDRELPLGIPARMDEWVRIIVPDAEGEPPTPEFERILATLQPLLGGRSPAAMDEAEHRDISFAARETGLEPGLVAALVRAFQLAEELQGDIRPAPLYALIRMLGAETPLAIASLAVEVLAESLRRSLPDLIADQGVPPVVLAATIHRRAAEAVLKKPIDTSAAGSLTDVLKPHLPEIQEQAELLRAFADHDGSVPEFWQQWTSSHPEHPVARIQMALQLAAVTGSHAPLLDGISKKYPEISTLRALTLELDPSGLAELLGESPAPDQQQDESAEQSRQRFAAAVSGILDTAHPTAAVARLSRTWAEKAPDAVPPQAAVLMRQLVLASDYELGSGRLEELLNREPDVFFKEMKSQADRELAREGVLRLERLHTVSQSPKSLEILSTTTGPGGRILRGAFDISAYSQEAFLATYADQPEMHTQLAAVHQTASSMTEALSSVVLAAAYEAADAPLAVRGDKPGELRKPPAIPGWAQLFGNERLTQCEECNSIGGPASYFVQILEFLDKRCPPNPEGITPLDVLIGNSDKKISGLRPDLAHIKLSCENTNTEIPEIDINNEVLESCIVFGTSLAQPANDATPGSSAALLAAEPQNLKRDAYKILAEEVYPIQLPFDLTICETRGYLKQVEHTREQLVELFNPGDGNALAAERLGLTKLDFAIITGTAAPDKPSATLFNLQPQGADPEIGWASRLPTSLPDVAAVLGLSMASLLELCATTFISGPWGPADRELIRRLPMDVANYKIFRESKDEDISADVRALLEWVDIPIPILRDLTMRSNVLLSGTIVVDPPNSPDLDHSYLVHLDGSYFKENDTVWFLTENEWLKLHRFARLSLRSGMSFAELDQALAALRLQDAGDGHSITPEILQELGALKAVGVELKLHGIELLGLYGMSAPPGLWDLVFTKSGVASSDPSFGQDENGGLRLAAGDAGAGKTIHDHGRALAAAFNRQLEEVEILAERLTLKAIDEVSVLKLWRHSCLASALDIAVADLLDLIAVSGPPDPFSSPLQTLDFLRTTAPIRPMLKEVFAITGQRPDPSATKVLRDVEAAVKALDSQETAGSSDPPVEGTNPKTTNPQNPDLIKTQKRDLIESGFAMPKGMLIWLLPNPSDTLDLEWIQRLALLAQTFKLSIADVIVLKALNVFPAPTPSGNDGEKKISIAATHWWQCCLEVQAFRSTANGFDNWFRRDAGSETQPMPDQLSLYTKALATLAKEVDPSKPDQWEPWVNDVADSIAVARTSRAADSPLNVNDQQTDPGLEAENRRNQVRADVIAILKNLSSAKSMSVVDEFLSHSLRAMAWISARLTMIDDTRTAASQLFSLAQGDDDDGISLSQLRKGVQARHSPQAWLRVARTINDPLREIRRDALLACIRRQRSWRSDQEVYESLLLDPGTNAVVMTSRLSHAMRSVQRFVMAVQLGRWSHEHVPERERVSAAQIGPEWKLYLHSFRLTQANQEVFAYPYLYMRPELRDDMSLPFRNVMAFLRQNEPTPENIQRALMTYLEQTAELSSLEICGTYLQDNDFSPDDSMRFKSVLHVFGRTRGGTKRNYYYRRLNCLEHLEEWTPWAPVKLDIQSVERDRSDTRDTVDRGKPEAGVHLLPVVWRQKLFVFWPFFVRKVQAKAEPSKIDMTNGQSENQLPEAYWEVKLCWSCLENGNWTPRQITSDYHETTAHVFSGFGD